MLSVSRFTQFKIYDCALKINIMVKVGLECESSVDIIGKWTTIMRTIAIDAVEVAIGATFFFACIPWVWSLFSWEIAEIQTEIACIN